jgi:two-component system, NtrC family, sensor kinase
VQVLVNLLLNAADAMGGEGRITVEAREAAGAVEVAVADSGPGVPAADREHVFDPFFTTKEPGAGTGLGLAISRSIVEAYGGRLALDGDGGGARFVIRLPIWRQSPDAPSGKDSASGEAAPLPSGKGSASG